MSDVSSAARTQNANESVATSQPRAGDSGNGRKRSRGRRVLINVGAVVLLLGLVYFGQQSTGILCGTSLPAFGKVTCDAVGVADRKDWFDARSEFLKQQVAFSRTRTGCEITSMAGRSARPAAFRNCMRSALAPFDLSIQQLRGDGDRIIEYLDEGQCRTSMLNWRSGLMQQLELAKRVSSGSVPQVQGRLSKSFVAEWNGARQLEQSGSTVAIKDCGM